MAVSERHESSCPQSRYFCVSALQDYAVDAHVLPWSDSRWEGRREESGRLPVMTDGKYAMDDN